MDDLLFWTIIFIGIPASFFVLPYLLTKLLDLVGGKFSKEVSSEPSAMEDDYEVFELKYWNIYNRLLASLIVVLPLYLIFYYSQGKGKPAFSIILFFLVFLSLNTLNLMNEPKKIKLSIKGFAYNKLLDRNIEWSFVESISFTLPGRDGTFSNQSIEVTLKSDQDYDNAVIFHPRKYKNSKRLRKLFEQFAVSNGVKVHVEDRGV